MNAILFWLLPPIAGACIGYITNAIAIKMLFMPLREKRICGIVVPFTPGSIPRNRKQIAVSIARMVEEELFSSTIIKERCSQQDFRAAIKESVLRGIDRVFEDYTASVLSNAEKKSGGMFSFLFNGINSLGRTVLNPVKNMLYSGDMPDMICDAIIAEIPNLSEKLNIAKMVRDKIDAMDIQKVESILLDVIAKQLSAINIFGAVLGAFIGFVQIGISIINTKFL